jgi:protein-S-isoprenylcysteine O-methyltransferase Ste14
LYGSPLIAVWLLWAWPFLAYKLRAPKRKAQITVSASRWGIGIQIVAFFLAWSGGWQSRPPAVVMGALLCGCLAVVLSWTSVRSLGKQLRIHAGLYPDHQLVCSGPYRIVRHPIYAGMLALYLAVASLWTPWPLAAAGLVLFILGTEIRVRIEDRLLASRFGQKFAQYKASTPAYIPFVR